MWELFSDSLCIQLSFWIITINGKLNVWKCKLTIPTPVQLAQNQDIRILRCNSTILIANIYFTCKWQRVDTKQHGLKTQGLCIHQLSVFIALYTFCPWKCESIFIFTALSVIPLCPESFSLSSVQPWGGGQLVCAHVRVCVAMNRGLWLWLGLNPLCQHPQITFLTCVQITLM